MLKAYGVIKDAWGAIKYNGGDVYHVADTIVITKTSQLAKIGDNKSAVMVGSAATSNGSNGVCVCKDYDLIWGSKVSCEFRMKVVEICKELWGEDKKLRMANELMACMALETGQQFKSDTGYPDATGLVQFTSGKYGAITAMNETGYNDGKTITKEYLISLTPENQLNYVKLYFKMWKEHYKKTINDALDMYMTIWCPNATGERDDFVCYSKKSNEKFYIKNKSAENEYYDKNEKKIIDRLKKHKIEVNNGEITKGELRPRLKFWTELGSLNKANLSICKYIMGSKGIHNAKGIVTYRIWLFGLIEKHIPKSIKDGYKNQYKYVYHDNEDTEHEICIAEIHKVKEKAVSKSKLYSKPTHNKVVSDDNVTDGQTTRRVKYENGDIAEYGQNNGDTFWRLYKALTNDIELVKMPETVSYIKYTFSGTQRKYTGTNEFAGFIGALAKTGYNIVTTGSCFSEGSCFPSQYHVNGRSVDTEYFMNKEKDQNFIDAMKFFNFGERKVGNDSYFKGLKNASNGGDLHDSHLHSGEFDISKIIIIKE
ncbi:hypothetical protein HNQ02_002820 [Flavobacterium sp. 7E]|uniref:hypothetical protein n=1 Tax=Flavobacterium sp. 7E TaxID=2735898 RepID=UPI0015707555|nr:hypothetical protein [Flavobacterium sp. 7E]NRS89886.1 hypothetical protein [Flavobacterium sp. 7E]